MFGFSGLYAFVLAPLKPPSISMLHPFHIKGKQRLFVCFCLIDVVIGKNKSGKVSTILDSCIDGKGRNK